MLGKILSQVSRYEDKHKVQGFFIYLVMLIVTSLLFWLIGYDTYMQDSDWLVFLYYILLNLVALVLHHLAIYAIIKIKEKKK